MATIMMFGGNFAPRTWAFCHGQLIAVSANSALFSLLATQYGGDGQTTFALPDLRGRVPVGAGNGAGTTPRAPGQMWGVETQTLTVAEMPPHNHPAQLSNAAAQIQASGDAADTDDPAGNVLAKTNVPDGLQKNPANAYTSSGSETMAPAPVTGSVAVGNAGAGMPFNIMQPSTCTHFIICQTGIYPSRS
ncbi:phage tail protein [Ferruginivarius sediminum]|nr:tail fiber protein [Ferruginivarius sediminum]